MSRGGDLKENAAIVQAGKCIRKHFIAHIYGKNPAPRSCFFVAPALVGVRGRRGEPFWKAQGLLESRECSPTLSVDPDLAPSLPLRCFLIPNPRVGLQPFCMPFPVLVREHSSLVFEFRCLDVRKILKDYEQLLSQYWLLTSLAIGGYFLVGLTMKFWEDQRPFLSKE